MDEKEKINDSYLTIEAKTDINRMLGSEGSGGGSSFNTQLETSAGLTLGKGTDDEESMTASELEEIKNPSQLETTGGLTLGKGTEDEESLTAVELSALKDIPTNKTIGAYVFSGASSTVSVTEGANNLAIQNESNMFPANRLTGYTPGHTYCVTGTWEVSATGKIANGLITPNFYNANSNGEIEISQFNIRGMASANFTGTLVMFVIISEV